MAELVPHQRWILPCGEQSCRDLQSGRRKVIANCAVRSEQRFYFTAQLLISTARPIKEGRARFRLRFQSRVVEITDLPVALRSHKNSDE